MQRRQVTEADIWNVLMNETNERPGRSWTKPTIVIEGLDLNGADLYVAVDAENRHRIVSVFRPRR